MEPARWAELCSEERFIKIHLSARGQNTDAPRLLSFLRLLYRPLVSFAAFPTRSHRIAIGKLKLVSPLPARSMIIASKRNGTRARN